MLAISALAAPQYVSQPEGLSGLRAEAAAGRNSPARQIFDMLNRERVQAGLAPLAWDDRLEASAQQHAQRMAQQNKLVHQFPDEPPLALRLTAIPLNHSGENVAVAPTVGDAHTGLMESPPHRANILNSRYNAVGIGVVQNRAGLWVVQDFAERIPEISATAAADQIAVALNQVRQEAGSRLLLRDDMASLSSRACSMMQRGVPDATPLLQLPNVRYAVAYTTFDPHKLPADMLHFRAVRDVKRFAVGVCFGKTPAYPSGIYWIMVGFFGQ